jgi:predicted ATPase
MKERSTEQRLQDGLIPLVGRRDELKGLTAALCARRSCLVAGPSGIGKTRLIEEALRAAQQPAVRLRRPSVLHELLVGLAQQLSCPAGRFGDVRRATSIALKPAVQDALQKRPCCVVLDDVADADPRMYRFLQQVYYIPRVCLIVAARSRDSLGHLHKLLWDPRDEISLEPLSRVEASTLFASACQACKLDALDVGEFRRKVLAAAQGNPGQILTMCRLASRPEYQSGRHVLFLPLRIDALTAYLS